MNSPAKQHGNAHDHVESRSATEAQAAAASETVDLWKTLFGITIIILGQIVCAAQYIVEEFLLKPPNTATPMALVGLEGIWGTLVMCV